MTASTAGAYAIETPIDLLDRHSENATNGVADIEAGITFSALVANFFKKRYKLPKGMVISQLKAVAHKLPEYSMMAHDVIVIDELFVGDDVLVADQSLSADDRKFSNFRPSKIWISIASRSICTKVREMLRHQDDMCDSILGVI